MAQKKIGDFFATPSPKRPAAARQEEEEEVEDSGGKKAKCHHEGRFQASWLVDFPWVEHEEQKLFCRICKEAEVKSVSKSKVQNPFVIGSVKSRPCRDMRLPKTTDLLLTLGIYY